jgi:small subunit ribosomal protein S1
MQAIKPEGYQMPADPRDVLHQARETGRVLEAVVNRVTYLESGPVWEVSFVGLDGARGLVPRSEMDVPDPLVNRFVGQTIRVKVKGIDRETGLAACSRREAVADAAERLLAQVKEGQVLECLVRAVLPAGDGRPPRLVVDAGGGYLVEVPRRDAALSESVPLGAQYRAGQLVKAAVKRADPQAGILELSVKAANPDPWAGCPDYKRGDIVAGRVAAVARNKAGNRFVFVEAEGSPGVIGIAPVPLRGVLRRGDRVSCAVASFSRENRKLHLRIRGVLA